MYPEYPYLEVTKPDGSHYRLKLENIITKQSTTEVYLSSVRRPSPMRDGAAWNMVGKPDRFRLMNHGQGLS